MTIQEAQRAGTLQAWFARALGAAGVASTLPSSLSDAEAMAEVLDLARASELGVCPPASPLTAFIAGLAVGSHHGDLKDLRGTVEQLTSAAVTWHGERSADRLGDGGS